MPFKNEMGQQSEESLSDEGTNELDDALLSDDEPPSYNSLFDEARLPAPLPWNEEKALAISEGSDPCDSID